MKALILFALTLLVATILDAPVIAWLGSAPAWIGQVGHAITWIGKSDWMAWVLMIWALVAGFVAVSAPWSAYRDEARLALRFAVVIFLILLLSGILVQLLKHLIGRARPVHFEEFGAYAFEPLKFSFTWNSFPSGHSTTMGAVATIGAWAFARYRTAWITLAVAVGISRIATGNHYPSDVVAGLALGWVYADVTLSRLVRRRAIPAREDPAWAAMWRWTMSPLALVRWRVPEPAFWRRLRWVGFTILAALLVFLAFPGLDLAVSGLFFREGAGFWLDSSETLHRVREALYLSMQLLVLGSLLVWILGARAAGPAPIPGHVWAFIVTAFVIGPGLIANGLFKSYWGRARPADVDVFGGTGAFSMPFERAQECAQNCSFISGEGSGLSMVFWVAIALLGPALWARRWTILTPLTLMLLVGISLRVVKGRHFFSDTIFAILIMGGVALVLYHLFEIDRHRPRLTWAACRRQAEAILRYLIGGPLDERSLIRDALRVLRAVLAVLSDLGRALVGRPL